MKENKRNFTDEFKRFYKSKHNEVIEFEINEYMKISTQSYTPANVYFLNKGDKYSYSKTYRDVEKVVTSLIDYLDVNIEYTQESMCIDHVYVDIITIGERRSL